MEVEKTLRPGAQGTGKYMNRFGDRLVCVRHRIDRELGKRYTTVELILDERPCLPGNDRYVRDPTKSVICVSNPTKGLCRNWCAKIMVDGTRQAKHGCCTRSMSSAAAFGTGL